MARDRALGHRQLPRRARHARAARHLQRRPASSSPTCSRCSGWPTSSCSPTPSTPSPPATRARRCWRWPAAPRGGVTPAPSRATWRAARASSWSCRRSETFPPELLAHTGGATSACVRRPGASGRAEVVRVLDLLGTALEAVRAGADPRTQLELALVKAATPQADGSTRALLARIERLEQALAGNSAPLPSPPEPTAVPQAPPAPPLASPPAGAEPAEPEPAGQPVVATEPPPASEAAPTPSPSPPLQSAAATEAPEQPADAAPALALRDSPAREWPRRSVAGRARVGPRRPCAAWGGVRRSGPREPRGG